MNAFKRGKGLRMQMNEDEVRASGLLGSLKKMGKKIEKGVVKAGNTVAKPTKKLFQKSQNLFVMCCNRRHRD